MPFVSTFHTLARVKAEGGDPEPGWRDRAEAEIIQCSDAICVSCVEEEQQFRRLYGNPHGRIEIIAPGVEHALFAPGDQLGARRAIGADPGVPLVVFVGRIQPLKGPDVAIQALADLQRRGHPDARLIIIGGASGQGGGDETQRAHDLVDELDLHDDVLFVPPQPHHVLSSYYRAADIVVVPSRSESFGLVALEAAACGTPVVASAVGGLLSLVDDRRTGRLIPGRNPSDYGAAMAEILDDPELRAAMSRAARERAVVVHVACSRSASAASLRRAGGDAVGELRGPTGPRRRARGARVPMSSRLRRVAARGAGTPDRRVDRRARRGARPHRGGRPCRGRRHPVVRPNARRGEGVHHGVAHARPTDVPLRDLRDAGPGGERSNSSTRTSCVATTVSSARTSRSAPRTRSTSGVSCPLRSSTRTRSTGSSARSTQPSSRRSRSLLRIGYASRFADDD